MGGGEWSPKCSYPAGEGVAMTKRLTQDDYARRYEAKRQAGVLEKARAWAADKGEAFVVFIGGVPGSFARSEKDAVNFARSQVRAGLNTRDDLKIRRIKV